MKSITEKIFKDNYPQELVQHPFRLLHEEGIYIPDFYCPAEETIFEVTSSKVRAANHINKKDLDAASTFSTVVIVVVDIFAHKFLLSKFVSNEQTVIKRISIPSSKYEVLMSLAKKFRNTKFLDLIEKTT